MVRSCHQKLVILFSSFLPSGRRCKRRGMRRKKRLRTSQKACRYSKALLGVFKHQTFNRHQIHIKQNELELHHSLKCKTTIIWDKRSRCGYRKKFAGSLQRFLDIASNNENGPCIQKHYEVFENTKHSTKHELELHWSARQLSYETKEAVADIAKSF